MGPFDWLRGKAKGPPPAEWAFRRESGRVVVNDGKKDYAFDPARARSVRVAALGAASLHGAPGSRGGWQVAVHRDDGDIPVGAPLADGTEALAQARRVCEVAELPLDELTERLFSQVASSGLPDAPR